jgi:6-phosphogluconolactonase (cycloisomerase 2 family)
MKEKKMVALSEGIKRELGALSSMLAKTVGIVSLVAILASCGTSPGYNYTVGGTVDGLVGSGLVLQNNGGDDHPISADGYFTFTTPLTDGAAYNITVKTQPASPAQSCRVVSNGTGTINSNYVSNVVVSCTTSPTSIAFSVESGNEFAYVANDDSTILTYLIDLLNGGFTEKGTTTAGAFPSSIAVDPSGKFTYVANTNDNTISTYTIDSSSGELNSTCGISPLCPSTGKYPIAVTVDPSGKFAYVVNEGDGTISAYSIGSGGALTAIGSPVSTGTIPISIVTVSVGSLGEFAYVANMGDYTISAYSIGSTGALTAIGSPVSTGTIPVSITVDPSKQFAYVANEFSNSISIYTIDPTYGTLAASATPTVTVGTNPTSVVTVSLGSLGEFAYVTNLSDNTISAYSIDLSNGGALTAISGSPFTAYPTETSAYPTSITIDPSGQFAYVINAGDGSIWAYPINQSTGVLGTPLQVK